MLLSPAPIPYRGFPLSQLHPLSLVLSLLVLALLAAGRWKETVPLALLALIIPVLCRLSLVPVRASMHSRRGPRFLNLLNVPEVIAVLLNHSLHYLVMNLPPSFAPAIRPVLTNRKAWISADNLATLDLQFGDVTAT